MVSNTIGRLQQWYISNCDGAWEQDWGVEIGTLDNPGWSIKIDLKGTSLEDLPFDEFGYGVGNDAEESDDWVLCRTTDGVFEAFGGPANLEEMLVRFLDWADGHTLNPR